MISRRWCAVARMIEPEVSQHPDSACLPQSPYLNPEYLPL